MNAYVADGFKEDCTTLINMFDHANDLRFQTFCQIWKKLQFSLIFLGRETITELQEFCEEALYISKQFLQSMNFKERICALYLLYGIYYKMPCSSFKIKLKLSDWQTIMDLHNEIKEGEHHDANYILCSLIVDKAFSYSLFDQEFTFEKHLRSKEKPCTNPYSVLPALRKMTEVNQVLSRIKALSNVYHESKCQLSATSTGDHSLNFYKADFANEIMSDIRKFDKQQASQRAMGLGNKARKKKREAKQTNVTNERCDDMSKVKADYSSNDDSDECLSISDDDISTRLTEISELLQISRELLPFSSKKNL